MALALRATPMPVATQRLRELLRARGVPCRAVEDWLHLGPSGAPTGPRIRAHVETIHSQPGTCSVQLDVELVPWHGQRILESCGGFGTSVEEALEEALERFAQGALPVLLTAFVQPPEEAVRTEFWEIAGVRRQVFLGRLQERGTPASEAATRAWRGAVERALQGLALAPGTHWVRVFHAHQPGHPRTLEFLLDNHPCAELSAALEHAPWPDGPEATAQRLFLVIQGGVDVSRAVATFVDHAEGEPDPTVVVEEIKFRGATALEAEKLLRYLPQAFARTVLHVKLPFPDTVHLLSVSGRCLWTIHLPEEPLWQEALRRAEKCRSGESPMTKAQVISVLRHYPGIGGMIESMESADPERRLQEIFPQLAAVSDDATAQLRALRPPDPIPPRIAPFVSLLLGDKLPEASRASARRPWWKFW